MKINGLGCSLVDNLYSPVDFTSEAYDKLVQKNNRDVGIITGGLVFGEDLERASSVEYRDILNEITKGEILPSKNIGGPAIVAMIHIAQIMERNTEIRFFGARADDENGRYIKKRINSLGINTEDYVITEGATPFTDVLSDPSFNNNNGERSFINYIGAAGKIGGKDIPQSFFDADILIYGGTALTPGLHDDLSFLLKKGKEASCFNFVNTVYDFRNQNLNPDAPWPLVGFEDELKLIDLLIADNEEAVKISGQSTKEEAIVYFAEKGVRSVIITHGSENVLCYSDGFFCKEMGVFNMPVSKSARDQIRGLSSDSETDTTGCGDNFAGGVYVELAKQLEKKTHIKPSLKQAAAWGVVSGGFAALYQGGVFYEKKQGEKLEKIITLFEEYKQQIGYSFE